MLQGSYAARWLSWWLSSLTFQSKAKLWPVLSLYYQAALQARAKAEVRAERRPAGLTSPVGHAVFAPWNGI